MVGTAPPARRWLLLEQPKGWALDAWGGMRLDPAVRARIDGAVDRVRGRVLLVRRPGRGASTGEPPRWAVLDSWERPGAVWGRWQQDRDLSAAAAALAEPWSHPGWQEDPADGTPSVLLVCTHGRRDVCCAVRGRPVAEALARQWPEATWEASHVGGDRFAANLVVLPDGAYYGGTDPGTATALVQAHLGGRPDARYLRGRAGLPPECQAALVAGHERLGPLPWGAVRVTGCRSGHEEAEVDLQVAGAGRYRARLVAEQGPPARLTCRARAEMRATVWVTLALEPLPALP